MLAVVSSIFREHIHYFVHEYFSSKHMKAASNFGKKKVSYPPGNMNVFYLICGNLIQSIANLVVFCFFVFFLIDVKEFIYQKEFI